MRIDAHQHFWTYAPEHYPWITGPLLELKRDFLPGDLEPLLSNANIAGCVAVQARQTIEETRWLLSLADQHPFIRGVVGWVDLQSRAVEHQLAGFAGHPKFVGVRHVVQDEPDDAFMLRPAFLNGLRNLRPFGLTYDLLLFPRHLPVAVEVVGKFPEQRFVLDHLAKPCVTRAALSPWKEDIKELARFPNVWCKLSGLVTEAAWKSWKDADFVPYLDVAFEAFGEERLIYGSDWPVCLLSASYMEVNGLITSFLTRFSEGTRQKIWGSNAAQFYGLK